MSKNSYVLAGSVAVVCVALVIASAHLEKKPVLPPPTPAELAGQPAPEAPAAAPEAQGEQPAPAADQAQAPQAENGQPMPPPPAGEQIPPPPAPDVATPGVPPAGDVPPPPPAPMGAAPAAAPEAAASEITPAALHEMIEKKEAFFLLDVRQPEEYAQNHLDNATLIPLADLQAHQNDIPHDKKIVVYCRSGARSAQAVTLLKAQGYKDVVSLAGGITAWK